MRYWGVDIGKEVIVGVARDETGQIVARHTAKNDADLAKKIDPEDTVACEWTGGRGRIFLETLWSKGARHLYIYKGNLRADRQHLGYMRKGDLPDAETISYAVWASFQPNIPFRPNALMNYLDMREVYELRVDLGVAEQYTKERLRWQQRREALLAKGLPATVYATTLSFLQQQEEESWNTLRRKCMQNESVVEVMRILLHFFPRGDRAVIKLALHIAPLERFSSESALQRYCGVLPESAESGGHIIYRKRGRSGSKQARVAMYQLLMPSITIGNGVNGSRRGKWRDYYDKLRRRLSDGEAWIRMMYRLLHLVWKAYRRGEYQQPLPAERRQSRHARKLALQQEVLEKVLQGYDDNSIARLLGISPSTITKWKRRDDVFWKRYEAAKKAFLEEQMRNPNTTQEASQDAHHQ
ncbi:MAG: hypothetical protein KatS3mg023_0574 [Armatimonadota bacterium]|nr:MAG: hypothetical protein KatS3mg023_0574 [Armatimonadota bacterium]